MPQAGVAHLRIAQVQVAPDCPVLSGAACPYAVAPRVIPSVRDLRFREPSKMGQPIVVDTGVEVTMNLFEACEGSHVCPIRSR